MRIETFLHYFSFAQPGFFALLLLAIPLFFLKGKAGAKHRYYFSSLSILGTLGTKPKKVFGGFSFPLLILPLLFFSIALARPQWTKTHKIHSKSGVDIVLAIDVSESMQILDFELEGAMQKRLYAARELAKSFIDKRPNDRIGVIAFAGRPYQVSPITMHHDWLPQLIDAEVVFSKLIDPGTAIGSAISYASVRLDTKAKDSISKLVILITDGSWNSGQIAPEPAAELAKDLGIKIYSLAIGTEWGRLNNRGHNSPKQEFDTDTLKKVAQITDGKYYRAKTTESLRDAFNEIDKLEKVEGSVKKIRETTEYHHWFTLAGVLSLLLLTLTTALTKSEID